MLIVQKKRIFFILIFIFVFIVISNLVSAIHFQVYEDSFLNNYINISVEDHNLKINEELEVNISISNILDVNEINVKVEFYDIVSSELFYNFSEDVLLSSNDEMTLLNYNYSFHSIEPKSYYVIYYFESEDDFMEYGFYTTFYDENRDSIIEINNLEVVDNIVGKKTYIDFDIENSLGLEYNIAYDYPFDSNGEAIFGITDVGNYTGSMVVISDNYYIQEDFKYEILNYKKVETFDTFYVDKLVTQLFNYTITTKNLFSLVDFSYEVGIDE